MRIVEKIATTFLLNLLVAVLREIKSVAAEVLAVEAILKQCEDTGLDAEDCEALIESNGHVADLSVVSALQHTDRNAPDPYYYQVYLYVDFHGYVLGRSPIFDGTVIYPYEWRGDPKRQLGTRSVGPWDCKGLTDVQCCGKIERDVFDADINGNHLSCFLEEAHYIDPVTKEHFGVYLNPVDGSINYLTADDLSKLEEGEVAARTELIALIDDTIHNKDCPKATIQKIHAGFLHAMRGVPSAREYPKYTKEAMRRINAAHVDTWDVAEDTDLQYGLPLMKKVIEAVSANGGLHPLTEARDGYVVQQLGDAETTRKVNIIGDFRSAKDPARTPDDVVKCMQENSDSINACADLLDGVKVVTVHPRSITDKFYNQVVIPVDYKGLVVGVQPEYDGMIYYKFDWNGNEAGGLGLRGVGPWDCKDLTDVQCCDKIQTNVPDLDVNGNYLDCWIQESFYKDPFTKQMRKIDYNQTSGTIDYASNEEIATFEILEQKQRARLIQEIEKVSLMTKCPKDRLKKMYANIRHAVRGRAEVQGDPQIIRDVILLQSGDTVDVANNVFLQTSLPKISSVLSDSLAARSAAINENTVVVVIDNNLTVDVGRFRGDA